MSEPAAKADSELAAEQAHLAASRAQLARMRERTASLDAAAAGDWVSREYLESTFALRMKQLADDPSVRCSSGGSTTRSATETSTSAGGTSPIPAGEPMVIDWRAPVSAAVLPRQPHRADGGRAAPPVRLPARAAHGVRGRAPDRPAEAERALRDPRDRDRAAAVGPMRDIVATIQPEQDVIVRADRRRPSGVQGAPGHREDRGRPAPRRVPALRVPRAAARARRAGGRAERQLPALHPRRAAGARRDRREPDHRRDSSRAARQASPPRSAARTRAAAPPLKGDARMAEVLDGRCGHSCARADARRWSCRAARAAGGSPPTRSRRSSPSCGTAASGTARRRAMLPQHLAHADRCSRWRRPARPPTTGCRTRWPAASRCKAYVDAIWPTVDPPELLLRLLPDADVPGAARRRDARPTRAGAAALAEAAARGGRARWSLADAVLVDEAPDLVSARPASAHIVARRGPGPVPDGCCGRSAGAVRTGSVTVLGDLAQATTPWATRSWAEALATSASRTRTSRSSPRGFRVPGDVIDYAARLLPVIAPA